MTEENELRSELEDRLTDHALQEVLGSYRPPDLTARILSAAQPLPTRRWRRLALAATVLLALGAVVGVFVVHRNQQTPAPEIAKAQPAAQAARDGRATDQPSSQAAVGRSTETAPPSEDTPVKKTEQEQLAELVDEFNRLVHEKRFAEAEVVANHAAEIASGEPGTLLVQQLKNQLRMVSRTENYKAIREPEDEAFVAALNAVEESAIAADERKSFQFGDPRSWQRLTMTRKQLPRTYPLADLARASRPNEPPILYPDPEVWQMLAERRKKFKAVDLTRQSEKEAKIVAALDEKTDLDFSDQPLTDVIDYLKQRHNIEIQLDRKAMSDSGVSTDPAITRRIKGVSLRSALKLVLAELDLTYVIRNDVLVITSKATAEQILEKRQGSSANKRLRTPVRLTYKNVPLKQVIEDLSKLAKLPIVIDASSAEKERVTADTLVTIELASEISTKSALDLVLQPLHLGYVVDHDGLRIASEDDCDANRLIDQNHDRYARIIENPFLSVAENPLSTFGIDVDTASYAKVRRYILQEGQLPPPDAVRIEELINYFDYDYAPPQDNLPFAAHVEVAACPWQVEHRLVRIGLKGRQIPEDDRPATNLVFLLDVSGSMEPDDKLPRAVRSMRLLVERLRENDRVAIVTYAGESGLALPSTTGFQKERIAAVLDSLHAGGSTNGASGIRLAYETAQEHFIKGGTNRVILCTDGDFNVGTTSTAELERLIEERAKGGVFLTVLGFGMGNHNDEMMEKLADKGNGNYGFIDSEAEARKLLIDQAGGTLVTIAKDVKAQLEFNPRLVAGYRLIGYEDRLLAPEDFNDDRKDAGDIGAGHTVTALYELIPAGQPVNMPPADDLKYQRPAELTPAAAGDEILTLKLKYKLPDGEQSEKPLAVPVKDSAQAFGQASVDFQFTSSVAGFGMLLRDSQFKGNLTYGAVREIAEKTLGPDPHGRRTEFLQLVRQASALDAQRLRLEREAAE